MGGTPVFCGTRVPVQTLLDYLKAGDTINEFLAGFPSVSREQVIAFFRGVRYFPILNGRLITADLSLAMSRNLYSST